MRGIFAAGLLLGALAVCALPVAVVFERQPVCRFDTNTGLTHFEAEVNGRYSLQWLSNNVALPGATNATLTVFLSNDTRAAFVLMASNRFGVVPSALTWNCVDPNGFGYLSFASTNVFVRDPAGTAFTGKLNLFLARASELLGSEALKVDGWEVVEGRITNRVIRVPFRPGTLLSAQFEEPRGGTWVNLSRIFRVTVGTRRFPGRLDTVEAWSYRPQECKATSYYLLRWFQMWLGESPIADLQMESSSCNSDFRYRSPAWSSWRKNGVPITETHPLRTRGKVTLADAGVYELIQSSDYEAFQTGTFPVELWVPRAPLKIERRSDGQVALFGETGPQGAFRLERGTNLIDWQTVLEGRMGSSGEVIELHLPSLNEKEFFRFH